MPPYLFLGGVSVGLFDKIRKGVKGATKTYSSWESANKKSHIAELKSRQERLREENSTLSLETRNLRLKKQKEKLSSGGEMFGGSALFGSGSPEPKGRREREPSGGEIFSFPSSPPTGRKGRKQNLTELWGF